MKITITRSFRRVRQIAEYVPVEGYCEVTEELDEERDLQTIEEASARIARFCESEVEKTLINYQPACIVCKGKGATVTLNKEGICGECVTQLNFQAKEFRTDAAKKRNENEPPATGTNGRKPTNN